VPDTASLPYLDDLAIVIPVRRGSSRIKEKCLLPFGDQPSLIHWKLSQLVKVIDPQRIYISSEDKQFLKIADRFGASKHKREARISIGHAAPFRDVITGIVKDIDHQHIAWATVVCPLMTPLEYKLAFETYAAEVVHGPKDSLLGVNPVQDYYWSNEGALNYSADRDHTVSQDLPQWYQVTNSLYMAPRDLIMEREYFLGHDPFLFPLSRLAGVDIDYIEDYRIAHALYSVYKQDNLGELEKPLGAAA